MADKDQDKDKDQYKSWGQQVRRTVDKYVDKKKKKKKKKKSSSNGKKLTMKQKAYKVASDIPEYISKELEDLRLSPIIEMIKYKKKKKKEKTESEKMPHGMSRLSQQVIVKQPKKKLYEKVMLNPRKKYKKEKPKD